MKKILFILLFVFSLSIHSTAFSSEKIFVIFDASGSMWGQIDGKNKIVIAKDALKKFVKELPDDIKISFIAYGHRKKKDCKDVEEIFPLSKINKKRLWAVINRINPKGMTPICYSLKTTAQKAKNIKNRFSVILFSDGKETCNCNPCDLVKRLKNSGMKMKLNVVGFDVKGKAEEQLKCMAKTGGGNYFSAKNSKEFYVSTKKLLKKVITHNLFVFAKKGKKGYVANVFVYDSKGKPVFNSQTYKDEPAKFSVTPGTYTIKVKDEWGTGAYLNLGKVNVPSKGSKKLTAEFTNGSIHVYTKKNGKGYVADAYIYHMNGKQAANRQTYGVDPAKFTLLPGKYTVKVKDEWGNGKWYKYGTCVVEPDKTLKIVMTLK